MFWSKIFSRVKYKEEKIFFNEDYKRNLDAFKHAQQNFENADSEHIEAAIYDLKAARERLSVSIKSFNG